MRILMALVVSAVFLGVPTLVVAERQPLSDAELGEITAGLTVIFRNPVPVVRVNPKPATQANGNVLCGGRACIFGPQPGPNVRVLQTIPALPTGWFLRNDGIIVKGP